MIRPFIWFRDKADEAAKLYVSLFPNSRITSTAHWGEGAPAPAGSVLSVSFELDGVPLTAFNGGPHLELTPAFSLVATCKDQAEIDRYWEALLAGGGKESRCGWLVDRFGLSWQVVPEGMSELIKHPNAMKAMMGMVKLDIRALEEAGR
jgi:predicted 3-demethylubiquinone-9 3-methyltransferase (glyoxalase superfamily)